MEVRPPDPPGIHPGFQRDVENMCGITNHSSPECVNLRGCEDAIHAEDFVSAGELRRMPRAFRQDHPGAPHP
jgi:hypothetical protein